MPDVLVATTQTATTPKGPSPVATTTEAPAYHPQAPVMSFEAYGVKLEFCEDGEVIAEGHHTTQRFAAAANRVARVDLGLSGIFDDQRTTYADVASGVRQVWAIRLPKCDCPPERLREWGCDTDLHDCEPDPGFWRISWGDNGVTYTAETPGARPYMIGSW